MSQRLYRGKANKAEKMMLIMACIACLFLLLPQTAFAEAEKETQLTVDPVGKSENYTAVLYNNTNGLPTSEANAITETSEGFIWIGSYGGLVRYDGNKFERMDSTTGLGSVVSLFTDSKDRLWIGTNESGLALMENGEYTFFNEDNGLKGAKICSIEEDDNGNIYVGTSEGLSLITPELTVQPVDDKRVNDTYIEHVHHGYDGMMYVTTSNDDYFTVRDGVVVDYISHEESDIRNITDVLPDDDEPGMLYVAGGESRLYYTDNKLDPVEGRTVDISPLSSVIDISKIDDKIWVCARNGIGVIDDQGFHNLDKLPMNNSVTQVMADYEGDLWFISTRQGVMKLVSNRFSDVFERFGLEAAVVNSTCVRNRRMFVGTDTGLIVLDDDKRVTELPIASAVTASGSDLGYRDLIQMLDGNRIRSIIRDSQNRLWISTWRGAGLVCYDGEKAIVYTHADGLISEQLRSVCERDNGSMAVVVTGGVNIIEDGKVTASYGEKDGISQDALCVASAPDGDVLVGTNGGGIYAIGDGGIRRISKDDGLKSDIVMRIKYDSERKLFWIVASNSIAYMTEDYNVTTVTKFPYSNNFDMYENSKGDMWVLSSNGIYVVPTEDLIANETIRPVYYSMANGLRCIATANSYSELTDEGNLYIAGNTGVSSVNIEEPLELIDDLKQAVPFIVGDGIFYYPDKDGTFRIPYTVQRLTIYGYVYNYSLTDPKISYRLIGFDRKAVTVNRSELGPVTYTNLAGGTYSFVMELHDAMGRGNKTLRVRIEKEKALYEQTWFFIMTGILLSGIVYAIVKLYISRKMIRLEVRHREQAEKARISHELGMAGRIQSNMLPHDFPPFPDRSEFDIYASMEPAREVGGDFYDFFMIDDDHLCLVVADVAGKGIPASLFMMVSKAILKTYAGIEKSAAEILSRVNKEICDNNRTDMFVTVWLGILEISTGRLTAANAGHEYPALKKADGYYELLKDKHGLVLGGMEDVKYAEYVIEMSAGDKLFMYTDGVPEATNAEGRMFGTDGMIDALNIDKDASPVDLLSNVRGAVRDFVKDAEQFDDLTMLCLEYRG